jgi:hypothetical protein
MRSGESSKTKRRDFKRKKDIENQNIQWSRKFSNFKIPEPKQQIEPDFAPKE